MDDRERVELLGTAVAGTGGTWGDFGSGTGAFALALAELLGPGARICSVDLDARALERQRRDMARLFPSVRLRTTVADFTEPLDLCGLDGVLVANALHYVRELVPALRRLASYLRAGGIFVVVEYEGARANPWVPFPLPYARLCDSSEAAGLPVPELRGTARSRYHGEMYVARSTISDPAP
jgi:SAM-dependent methyltransferase